MSKKYELTTETKLIDGHKVYRIKSLKSFDTIIGRKVNKGDLGGWVESEKNLSQYGKCWLFDDAAGYENSRRTCNSVGYDNSRQFGNSRQYGNSRQFGDSRQYDNSRQFGDSQQYGSSRQSGNSQQFGSSRRFGNSRHITGCDNGPIGILCTDTLGNSQHTATVQPENTTTPMITFPPLTDRNGNHETVLSVTFAIGPYSLEIVTDGAGAYLTVEIEGRAKLNPDELTALAAWVESVCKAMDKHNGEGSA